MEKGDQRAQFTHRQGRISIDVAPLDLQLSLGINKNRIETSRFRRVLLQFHYHDEEGEER